MPTTPTLTARDEIRATADSHGWAVEASTNWHDRFIRGTEVPADGPLARFFAVVDFAPCDLVVVGYDETGQVTRLATAGPGQQSAILGTHTGVTERPGTGRRAAALAFLTGGLPADA